jgi:hypothetical protein
MTLWAIDPGPHTGIFYATKSDQEFHRVTLDYTDELILDPHRHLYLWLMQMVDPDKDEIIYEPFEFRKDERDREYIDYTTGEYVGVIALYCQMTGTKAHRQMAAQAKQFWDDDKLKRAGMYIKGRHSRHVRDATRHWLHHKAFVKHENKWLHLIKK